MPDAMVNPTAPESHRKILRIAIPSPLRRVFDYLPAESMDNTQPLTPGCRVSVPFGRQQAVTGIIVDIASTSSTPEAKLRPINQIIDEKPAIDADILALCRWCASYYQHPLGEVLHAALPTLLRRPEPLTRPQVTYWRLTDQGQTITADELKRAKQQLKAWALLQTKALDAKALKAEGISNTTLKSLREKGLIESYEATAATAKAPNPSTLSAAKEALGEPPLPLNSEQAAALDAIKPGKYQCYLLEGVTGSGKTEVYLQAIAQILARGQRALVLVPEIGLTPQTLGRFQRRFKVPIALSHSGLTDKQRFNAWQDAKLGQAQIVIGTRSSIFTSIPQLGLIIVDEEHDLSYKQQEGIRYSARDLAVVRAQQADIPLLLGSATPSFESLHNALNNRYQHLKLLQPAVAKRKAALECIATAEEELAQTTLDHIEATLTKEQQVLVFINRRGYAPVLICRDCGWVHPCPRCDSRMTLHHYPSRLHCHHCGAQAPVPKQCPNCHSSELVPLGQGTQRSEAQLQSAFPHATVIRIDRDTTRKRNAMNTALAPIEQGKSCILVGTQMLAKGHHFPKVSLVVILGIDNHFFSSDFRGLERMGQLLTQVAGRAGRESLPGRVLIQTQFADHPLMQLLLDGGYHNFAVQQLQARSAADMPPYYHMALIRAHAQKPKAVQDFLQQARIWADSLIPADSEIQCLGPFPATLEKRNNRYHYQLQIKAKHRRELHQLLSPLSEALENAKQPAQLHWVIDVDPLET